MVEIIFGLSALGIKLSQTISFAQVFGWRRGSFRVRSSFAASQNKLAWEHPINLAWDALVLRWL
jgi:hypothetical protein